MNELYYTPIFISSNFLEKNDIAIKSYRLFLFPTSESTISRVKHRPYFFANEI